MGDRVRLDDIGGEGPYDFFVSYVPADQEWAGWIAWQLEERLRLDGRQPKVFVRHWNVVTGMHETASRQFALTASARLVVVLTPEYLASARYSVEEWATVWSDDPVGVPRRVLPVRVKACRPDGFLRSIQSIDLVDQDAVSATDELLSGINASIEGRAKPVTAPAFPGLGRPTENSPAGPPFPGPPVLVGEPPTVPPKWFQDRNADVEDIERHLGDARTGLVMVVGREGFGKTAMIHRLWERIDEGTSPLRVHGLVYLSAHGFRPVTADRVIDGLIAMFPTHEADQLEVTVRQHLPWVEKLVVLLDALAGRHVIVAIDAIEEVLDDEEDIADPALRELVDYLVPRAGHGVRLLLIGRYAARAVAQRFPGAMHQRNLGKGLLIRDAFALLEAMDADGMLNFGAVPDHDRDRLHRLTGGSPRALELAYGALAHGDCSFTQLLEFMQRVDGEGVVVRLLDRACERLSLQERRVLQALAVYGRPVPAAAVHYLVGDDIPDLDSGAVLRQLCQLRLAQSEGVYFSVPATEERDHLIELLRRDAGAGPRAPGTPETLLHRAADYFAGQRCREPQWLADLRPHLIEIELKMRAGDYETAFELMADVDDGYLYGWGSSSALVPSLRTLLRGKDIPRKLEIDARSMLARALTQQEDYQKAAEELVRAFGLAAGAGRAPRRIVLREQLTEAYLHLGDLRHAAMHSRRAFLAAISRMRTRDAMTALGGWAMCLAKEGSFRPSLLLFKIARKMLARFGAAADRVQQPTMLLDEAWVHGQLGARDRARSLLRESQHLAVKLGHRDLEGTCVLGEAQLALDDRDLENAVALAEKASAIGVRNGNRSLCRVAMEILALARLDQDDLEAAARAAGIARRNGGSVIGMGLVGLAAYRRGEDEDARAAFHEGHMEARKRYQANERDFQFLEAYGLVTCGLALLGEPSCLNIALTVYRRAREFATGPGAVERALMLIEQFEPRADVRVLDHVRAAAKGERSGRALLGG